MAITPTIYVVGNTQSFIAAFTAIQMLFNAGNNTLWAGSNYSNGFGILGVGPVIIIGSVISLMFMGVSAVLKQKYEMHHILMMYAAYLALFVPTMTVNVENLYDGTANVVSGIPVGIAVPGAVISNISEAISNQIGQAFQSVSTTTYATQIFDNENGGSGGVYGFAGPLAATYQLRGLYNTFAMGNPQLEESVAAYVANCVLPQGVDWAQLTQSPDLGCTLFGSSEAGDCAGVTPIAPGSAQTTLYVNSSDQSLGTSSNTTTCANAQTILGGDFQDVMTNNAGTGGQGIDAATKAKTAQADKNAQSANNTAALVGDLLQNTTNAGYAFMNNLILNCATENGIHAGSAIYDPNMPAGVSSYCVTKASAIGRQQAMNAGAASMFETNMLSSMSILQFLFFAMAPLVAAVSMMMGTMSYGMWGKYFMFGAWTQSWMPVAALINDYAQQQTGKLFSTLATVNGGAPLTSPSMLPKVLQQASLALSNANLMLSMTPVITLAILTGSYYALSQVAQNIRGTDVVDKNMSESTPTIGSSTLGGTVQGTQLASDGSFLANRMLPGQDAASLNFGSTWGTAASAARQSGVAAQASAAVSAGMVGSTAYQMLESMTDGQRSAMQHEVGEGYNISNARQTMAQATQQLGVSENQAAAFSTILGVDGEMNTGGSIPLPKILSAAKAAGISSLGGVKLGGKMTAQEQARVEDAVNSSSVRSLGNTLSNGTTLSLLQGMSTTDGSSMDKRLAGSLAENAQRMRQDQATAKNDETQALNYQTLANQASSMGGNASLDTSTLAQRVEQRYGGDAQGVSAISGKMDQLGLGAEYQQALKQVQRNGNSDPLVNAAQAAIMVGNRNTLGAAGVAQLAFGASSSIAGSAMSVARQAPMRLSDAAGQTDAAGNHAATAAVPGAMASTEEVTGSPNTQGTEAMYAGGQGGAQQYLGQNPNADYGTSTVENTYMNQEPEMQQALSGGLLPKSIENAARGGNMGAVANWMSEHPELAAAAGLAGMGAGFAAKGYMTYKAAQAVQAAAQNSRPSLGKSLGQPDAPSDVPVVDNPPPTSASPNVPTVQNPATSPDGPTLGERMGIKPPTNNPSPGAPPNAGPQPLQNDANAMKDIERGNFGKAAQDLAKNAELPGGGDGDTSVPLDDLPL
ncbi:conjugal transfer protein TraG N-terminal domain-containing protein [Acidithiobacillus ferriphilus]|uniref:conjugal transfer protein TraG N-terminal domain-containing protein n=1 Tax=Acidithiobacillus ferriphilus TaxID=1689834 RepID=UPI002DB63B84|nr:conjugal transfer protein TraG N-terminal domain-containing protein [Acidithiobacillus ferriphilus]MEB8476724.1 conjugal transfer protein TraG N-terminal domain-containing protein [Acidithiobacillus ferriphilus]